MSNTNSASCRRCGGSFIPQPIKSNPKTVTTFCEECQFRNFLDNLDLPTPPDFIDRHTKHPALTKDEFKTKIASVKNE